MQTKQAKRAKADAMNEAWRKLTPQQQIKELQLRPGESKKQIARLKAKIEENKK